MKNKTLLKMLKNLLARILTFSFRIVPTTDQSFVFGSPDIEANTLALVMRMQSLDQRKIYWLNAPPDHLLIKRGVQMGHKLSISRKKYSLTTIWNYLRSDHIFVTTELYGMPSPNRKRTITNLWHGEGIKSGRLFPHRTLQGPSSTFLIGATKAFQAQQAENAAIPINKVLLTGSPRIDFLESKTPARNSDIHWLRPESKFVLWLPTFRAAKTTSGELAWRDSDRFGVSFDVDFVRKIARKLSENNIQLICKPHYLDFDSFSDYGVELITDKDLRDQGLTLYDILGKSDGLISDYSSVWVDYLHVDKPIAFLIDDVSDFWSHRPRQPGSDQLGLPGINLQSEKSIMMFCREVHGSTETTKGLRVKFSDEIGLVHSTDHSKDVLEQVGWMR